MFVVIILIQCSNIIYIVQGLLFYNIESKQNDLGWRYAETVTTYIFIMEGEVPEFKEGVGKIYVYLNEARILKRLSSTVLPLYCPKD